jgi:hypothetical protein
MAYANTHKANPHWLPPKQGQNVDHVPGSDGWPLVGTTLDQLKDPMAFSKKMIAKYGPVYRSLSFGGRFIALTGPDANELVLLTEKRSSHPNKAGDRCSTCCSRAD